LNIIKVSAGNGSGMEDSEKYNKVVDYNGMKVIIKL